MSGVGVFWLVDWGMNVNSRLIITVGTKSKFQFNKADCEIHRPNLANNIGGGGGRGGKFTAPLFLCKRVIQMPLFGVRKMQVSHFFCLYTAQIIAYKIFLFFISLSSTL
jgi:hypothetical protein